MLNRAYISCFENSVDPDQLASQKPADLDPHCLHRGARIAQLVACLTLTS